MSDSSEGAEAHAEASIRARPEGAFEFGRNWQRYVEGYLDAERERIALASLQELLGAGTIGGRSFLDMGAGSGLFSLCAHGLGARTVTSVDVDLESVESCRRLRASAGEPGSWEVLHGSVLERDHVDSLESADIVYSWGVLHHTGDMYTAIRNAAELVVPGGLFAIAIYNRVEGKFLDSHRWLRIKRLYNRAPAAGRLVMKALYFSYWLLSQIRNRRNPWRVAREYKHSRGMALRTDLWDWLGGYPYEYASIDEIVDFCQRNCAMVLKTAIPTTVSGTGNNQLVFRRAE